MDGNTKKGLYFLIIGTIITMICSFTTSLLSFFIQDTEDSLLRSMVGRISFIGAILILIGIIFFFFGRKEFGEKHHKNVKNAVITFAVTLVFLASIGVLFITSMIITVLNRISASDSSTPLATPTSLMLIIMMIGATCLGSLIYYFALIELEDTTGKKILYTAIAASIIISIVISFYIAGTLSELFSSLPTENTDFSAFPVTQNYGKIGILGIISSLLFLYSYYRPYKRMKDGELVMIASSVDQKPRP